MKWFCRRDRNQTGVWIAIMAVLISTNRSTVHHHHLSGWWFVGVAVGLMIGLAIVVWRRRCL